MPSPCKECPFRRDNPARHASESVIIYIGKVCEEEGQLCHTSKTDRECEGARRFFEGGHADVFDSYSEFAASRGQDNLAFEFFEQMERLLMSEV